MKQESPMALDEMLHHLMLVFVNATILRYMCATTPLALWLVDHDVAWIVMFLIGYHAVAVVIWITDNIKYDFWKKNKEEKKSC